MNRETSSIVREILTAVALALLAGACASRSAVPINSAYPLEACVEGLTSGEGDRDRRAVVGEIACQANEIEFPCAAEGGCGGDPIYVLELATQDRTYPLVWAYSSDGTQLEGYCSRDGRYADCPDVPNGRSRRIECGSRIRAEAQAVEPLPPVEVRDHGEAMAEIEEAPTPEERRRRAEVYLDEIRAEALLQQRERYRGHYLLRDVCLLAR